MHRGSRWSPSQSRAWAHICVYKPCLLPSWTCTITLQSPHHIISKSNTYKNIKLRQLCLQSTDQKRSTLSLIQITHHSPPLKPTHTMETAQKTHYSTSPSSPLSPSTPQPANPNNASHDYTPSHTNPSDRPSPNVSPASSTYTSNALDGTSM